ncbi:Adaptive-response sensory-kinase SasA [subsurface metagenome]
MLGIVILQDGLTVYANEAFSNIVEYSIEEILNWKPGEFERAVHPGEKILEMDRAQKKIVNHYQCRIVTKSGITKYVGRYSQTIPYDGKKADMATFIDITEKKMAEEKAKIQQQQLIQADKLASIGVLAAGVAHEINNPNHSIMSHANVIGKAWKNINPILEEYYEENGDFSMGGLNYTEMRKEMPICHNGISYASKRIDTIVSDLKNFARQEERYEITADINMNLVVKSSVALASNFISKATKNFRVELTKEIPKIKGNFQRLEQVLLNLIQNACQALRKREEAVIITTSYNRNKQRVEVNVRDEGEGMPPEDLSRIEDPFFTTRRTAGGTGLGLSISSSIIEDHHGTLSFKTKPGKGTTATIEIPVSKK